MEDLRQITEFKSSPELVEKLYKHSIQKNYEAGSIILNENSHIRSIPIVTKGMKNFESYPNRGRRQRNFVVLYQSRGKLYNVFFGWSAQRNK